MWKLMALGALLFVGGCVASPLGVAGDGGDLASLLQDASTGANKLVETVTAGGEPDYPALQLSFERARMAVVAQMALGIGSIPIEKMAGLGAIGATLIACQDASARLEILGKTTPELVAEQARERFWPTCAVPLGLAAIYR